MSAWLSTIALTPIRLLVVDKGDEWAVLVLTELEEDRWYEIHAFHLGDKWDPMQMEALILDLGKTWTPARIVSEKSFYSRKRPSAGLGQRQKQGIVELAAQKAGVKLLMVDPVSEAFAWDAFGMVDRGSDQMKREAALFRQEAQKPMGGKDLRDCCGQASRGFFTLRQEMRRRERAKRERARETAAVAAEEASHG